MNATRPLQSVVRKFLFPVACFACVAWVAVFVVIYLRMPRHNLGITILIVISGVVLLFPWLGMVLAVLRRIGGNSAENKDDKS